ncbi:MAG TPA: M36 family metallopeptidase [Pyrinomonadaceae bacterium]|nr:M36 family metallopeptidase [Pyrinomonadaceae bacterium]
MRRQRLIITLTVLLITVGLLSSSTVLHDSAAEAAAPAEVFKMYARPAPNFDLNLSQKLAPARRATQGQLAAIEALKANTQAANMTVRWNDFGGSPDVLMDFSSPTTGATPEEAGRTFLAANGAAFGITNVADLRLVSDRAALGGHLLRFQQTYQGIDVQNGGVGLVLNKDNRVIMASGPTFRDVNVSTQPTLTAEQAKQKVTADLARFSVSLPANVQDLLRPGLEAISKQLAAVQNLQPRLAVYPTANGYRLVWKVAKFSTNPFGLYLHMIDANTGEVVSRQDFAYFLQNPATGEPFKGDIYPKYPEITQELKDEGKISVENNVPKGQVRATLRKFDASNMATGVNGTLTGTHALVNNILATKQPFPQAAKGTWYFQKDDPTNFEARTNEQSHFGPTAEPAEHQDDINAFFFVTYLLEYVDYLHVAGDAKHSRVGEGDFPDDYPNHDVPLPANVHAPNIYIGLSPIYKDAIQKNPAETPAVVLGLDNAVAFNATGLIRELTGTQSPVNLNPTIYGHGYLLNDLALEGTVPYHEGMHAITSPIAGLEGTPEGPALNEGQADMWAFTITNNPSLGEYVVNAYGYRNRFRAAGRDPDSIAYVRSALSTLKYSDIGTLYETTDVLGNPIPPQYVFEEHRDGEIYMSTMWDVRQMLNRVYPEATTYKRPKFEDGTPGRDITKGTETFERIFLGSMYVLGTTSPDTMVKARDAMIIADQSLYPSDASDPDSPGLHRALIEQVFAAHEMGINAKEVVGDRATISTQVSHFAAGQSAPAVPQNVTVAPASATSNKITWSPVEGAVAYEVLKRKISFRDRREPNGGREFLDGDAATTGWRHVAYTGASSSMYEDRGVVAEVFAPAGLKNLFDSEYAVRAIGVNASKQLGVSDLSGAAQPRLASQDVTTQVDTALSNVSFSGGVFSFDTTVTNARGANSIDKTIYAPVEFRITSISDPSVTVKNADQSAPVPTFIFNKTLAVNSSATKRFEFNDPLAKMFTFDAQVTGQAYAGSTGGTGSQTGDGSSDAPPTSFTYSIRKDEYSGIMPLGDPTGATNGSGAIEDNLEVPTDANPTFQGVTYVDIPVTTTSDALILDAELTSTTAVDYDLELLTADGQTRLDRSADTENFAHERIRYFVQPNTTYIIRIIGFLGVASDYKVVAKQYLPKGSANANSEDVTVNADGSETTAASGGVSVTGLVRKLFRFTVNPLTRTVSAKLLK